MKAAEIREMAAKTFPCCKACQRKAVRMFLTGLEAAVTRDTASIQGLIAEAGKAAKP